MKDIRGNRENRIIKNSKGFTLLETLLVVAIIAVLLGISIMGGSRSTKRTQTA